MPDTTPSDTEVPPSPENVMIVVIDDLGAGLLSMYGDVPDAPPTPTLEGLAAEGMLFRNAWSMGVCTPARASLLTGRYPSRTGVGMAAEFIGVYDDVAPLRAREVTLPEMLAHSPASWDSSSLGKWHLTAYEPGAELDPLEQGFAWHAGTVGNLDGSDPPGDFFRWTKNDNGQLLEATTYATTDTANDAIARIEAMTEPWLLHVAFHAPHDPYHVPPAELVTGDFPDLTAQYKASITALDVELGRVLASMDPEVRARTTLIVMGDNGTPDDLVPETDDAGRLKGSVYEGGVWVPLVVAGPRVAQPGTQSAALVNVVDLFPTIAEIAQVDVASLEKPIDGVSLLPVLADPTAMARDTSYTEMFIDNGTSYALRDDRYKLLVFEDWRYAVPAPKTALELYDLAADPWEATDLAEDPEAQDVLDRLMAEANELRSSFTE